MRRRSLQVYGRVLTGQRILHPEGSEVVKDVGDELEALTEPEVRGKVRRLQLDRPVKGAAPIASLSL